jgi:hypothetical protein
MSPGSSLPARRGRSRLLALSAAVALGAAPALAAAPASAAERVEFFDEVPDDGDYTGPGDTLELLVSAMTPADTVVITVDGREVLRTAEPANHRDLDLCTWCHLDDIDEEDAEELDEAFFTRGEPTDIWLSVYLDEPLEDGAQITVRVGDAEATSTFVDTGWDTLPEWTPTMAATVLDREVAASGLQLAGELHPTELAPMTSIEHTAVFYELAEDADVFWLPAGEMAIAEADGSTVSGTVSPSTRFESFVVPWDEDDWEEWEDEDDWDEESQGDVAWAAEVAERIGPASAGPGAEQAEATAAVLDALSQLRTAAEAGTEEANAAKASVQADAVPEEAALSELILREEVEMGTHVLLTPFEGDYFLMSSTDDGDVFDVEHRAEQTEDPGSGAPNEGGKTPGGERTDAPTQPAVQPAVAPTAEAAPRAHDVESLPRTGTELAAPLGAAAALLAVGAAAVVSSRVRRTT